MNGRISALTSARALKAPRGLVPNRGLSAALIAAAAGALALVFPPAALFVLALLGGRILLSGDPVRFDPAGLAGPGLAALTVGAFTGLDGAIGVLFVWRLIADTRWSVSEASRLAAAAGRPAETTFKSLAHAWMTPLYGLMLVAYTAPHMIAGLPLDLPHAPLWAVLATGALAAGAVFDWALRRAADWRLGELAKAPAAHLLIHHAIFLLAFGLMADVSAGIVLVLAWRLAQAAPRQASFNAVP
jgi:hypothetical protein